MAVNEIKKVLLEAGRDISIGSKLDPPLSFELACGEILAKKESSACSMASIEIGVYGYPVVMVYGPYCVTAKDQREFEDHLVNIISYATDRAVGFAPMLSQPVAQVETVPSADAKAKMDAKAKKRAEEEAAYRASVDAYRRYITEKLDSLKNGNFDP